MSLVPFEDAVPEVDESVFISSSSQVIGNVEIGGGSSIWFGAVLRGDMNRITVGECSNIQDLALVHVSSRFPVSIGDYVSVGHRVVLHGCEVGNNVLLGTGATVLDGARIGDNCLVSAATVVGENAVIPEGSLVMGIPGRVRRSLTPDELAAIRGSAENHLSLVERYQGTEEEEDEGEE